jgi:hypothetical protein
MQPPETTIKLIIDVAQFVIILIGAVWAYFKIWKEGLYRPRIQFNIECNSFSEQHGEIPVEFLLKVTNKGLVKHKFYSIKLRVRGIIENNELEFWKENEPRLYFPDKFFDTQFIHKSKYNFVFVEPGVEQTLTYVTKIDSKYKLITVRAEFEYDKTKTHSIEKVFEIKVTSNN